jgi:hypothetical protein
VISEGVSRRERGVSVGSGRSSNGFGSQRGGITLILNINIIVVVIISIFINPILFVQ